jgi:hypothetical protein
MVYPFSAASLAALSLSSFHCSAAFSLASLLVFVRMSMPSSPECLLTVLSDGGGMPSHEKSFFCATSAEGSDSTASTTTFPLLRLAKGRTLIFMTGTSAQENSSACGPMEQVCSVIPSGETLRTLPRQTSRWRYSPSAAQAAGRRRASTKERARSWATHESAAATETTAAKTEQRTRKRPSRHTGASEPIRARGHGSGGGGGGAGLLWWWPWLLWCAWAWRASAGESLESETLRRSSGGGSKRARVRRGREVRRWPRGRRRLRRGNERRGKRSGGGGARKAEVRGQCDIAARRPRAPR